MLSDVRQGTLTRRAILVLGMHRSGTSAMTRVLGLCGAALPKRMLELAPDNLSGFWEPSQVVAIHEEVLKSAGSSWHDISEFPSAWFGSEAARSFKQQLVAALRDEYADAPLFIIKDPRACRLVPLWLSVLDEHDTPPLFVISFRNPLEVAASLQERNDFPEAKSLLLWLEHFLAAERDTRGYKRAFVAYEHLLSDWRGTIEAISRELDIDWLGRSPAIDAEIDNFLRESMRHHTMDAAEIYARRDLVDWVRTTYEWATNAASGHPGSPRPLDEVRMALRTADAAFAPLVAEAERRLSQHSADMARLAAGHSQGEAKSAQDIDALRAQIASLVAEGERSLSKHVEDMARLAEQHSLSEAGWAQDANALRAQIASLVAEGERGLSKHAADMARLADEHSQSEARWAHDIYALRAQIAAQQAAISRLGDEMTRLTVCHLEEARGLQEEAREFKEKAHRLEENSNRFQEESSGLKEEIGRVHVELEARDKELKRLHTQINGRNGVIATLEAQLTAIRGSTSWRLTTPIRIVGNGIRRLRRIPRSNISK